MHRFRIPLMLLGFTLIAAASPKLPQPKLGDIRTNVYTYLNERVGVDGYVTEYIDANSKTTAFYYLKDDWGGTIRVRTSGVAPAVGRRYTITGVVGFDPRTQDAYISEEQRSEIGAAPPPAERVAPLSPATSPSEDGSRATKAWLFTIGGLGVVLLVIVLAIVIVLKRSRSRRPSTADVRRAAERAPDAIPNPQQVVEGRTIKLHFPPPNTVKMLPAWLEVVAGDDIVKQVRFYKLRGDRDEFTFGRADGRPYAHIQLKPMTVSSRQAKVEFSNGRVILTNFAGADSNPTKLNGHELQTNEAVPLTDKDTIEMGEVAFRFHNA
jgi:FHA domain